MNISRYFGKTAGILSQVVGMGLMFGVHAYAARGLGANLYGSFNILLAYIMISSTIAMFGASYYLPVYSNRNLDNQLITVYLLISLILSILTSIVFFIFGLIELVDFIYFLLGTVGVSWLEINRTLEVIKGRFFFASLIRYLLPGLVSVIYLTFLPLDSLNFYIVIFIVPFIIALPILKYFSLPSLRSNPFNKSVWVYFAMQITYLSYIHLVKVAQNSIATVEIVACFSLAYMIVRLILLVPSYMSLAYLPELSSCFKTLQKNRMLDIYNHIIIVSTLITINLVVLFWFYIDDIVSFYGDGYEGLGDLLRYLLILPIVIAFVGPNGPILIASKRINSELLNGLLLILFSVILTISFGERSIAFIALGVVLSEIALAARKRYLSTRILDFKLLNILVTVKLAVWGLLLYVTFYSVELVEFGLVVELVIKLFISIISLQIGYIFLKGKYELIKL